MASDARGGVKVTPVEARRICRSLPKGGYVGWGEAMSTGVDAGESTSLGGVTVTPVDARRICRNLETGFSDV